MLTVYLIGSLRNPKVQEVAKRMRAEGFDVFDDWQAAGPEADDYWKSYEEAKGNTYEEALAGYAAQHVYGYDKHHLERCNVVVLMLPAGRSGHLELGFGIGRGKPGFILLDDEHSRWDVMYAFADGVYRALDDLIAHMKALA